MECDMRVVFRVAHGGGKKRVKYKEEDTGAPWPPDSIVHEVKKVPK
jgi:hypothetical protein